MGVWRNSKNVIIIMMMMMIIIRAGQKGVLPNRGLKSRLFGNFESSNFFLKICLAEFGLFGPGNELLRRFGELQKKIVEIDALAATFGAKTDFLKIQKKSVL